jgi:hypothetical protein
MSEPAPRPSARLPGWLGPALLHAALVGAVLVRLVWGGASAQRAYHGMKITLPALTVGALSVSAWVSRYLYVIVPVLVVLLLADAVVLWRLHRRSPRSARRWGVAWAAVLVVAWATLEAGYFLPLRELYLGLSRQAGAAALVGTMHRDHLAACASVSPA